MFHFIKNLFKKFNIHRKYVYHGTIDEFYSRLKESKDLRYSHIAINTLLFRAKYSVGTLMINGFSASGIDIKVSIEQKDTESSYVYFKKDMKIELILILLAFFVLVVIFIFMNKSIGTILLNAAIGLGAFLWFHYLYRIQEMELMMRVVRRFNLKYVKNEEERERN